MCKILRREWVDKKIKKTYYVSKKTNALLKYADLNCGGMVF